jgi:hypothetical protein
MYVVTSHDSYFVTRDFLPFLIGNIDPTVKA